MGRNESTIKSTTPRIPVKPQRRADFSNNADAENASNRLNTNTALAIEKLILVVMAMDNAPEAERTPSAHASKQGTLGDWRW
jgi:hypothetical protein